MLAFPRSALRLTSCGSRLYSAGSVRLAAADVGAIKKLREMSGAPMMDCKNALSSPDVQGDLQKALAWLRAKGISKMAQSTRATTEGLIGIHTDSNKGTVALVEINCETDFVGINKDFQNFVALITETVSARAGTESRTVDVQELLKYTPPADVSAAKPYTNLEEALGDVIASIRETIVIKRASVINSNGGVLASYVHNKAPSTSNLATQLGKAVGVVSLKTEPAVSFSSDVASHLRDHAGRKLAMHVVAAKPLFLSAAQVSQSFLDQERAIFEEQSAEANNGAKAKSPEVLQKMIAGKVQKRLAEVCLLAQGHLAEEGNPVVSKYLDTLSAQHQTKVEVQDFALWTLNQQ